MVQHWHILGAGSIGCLWAAHLAKAGHRVTLILRNAERLATFKATPYITLETQSGNEQIPVEASIADNTLPITNLLITTKAYDTENALRSVGQHLSTNTNIVVLQNGMGAQQKAADITESKRMWAGSTTDGAWLRQPFHVVFAGKGETRVGPLTDTSLPCIPEGLTPSPDLTLIADTEIELSLWRKLAINCAINPLTAYYDCRNGALAEDIEKRQHMALLCQEIEQVALAKGLALFPQGVFTQAEAVAIATGENLSSMLQDVRHQRKTELDYITGYLLREAEKQGISLPANQQLFLDINQRL